MLDALRQLMLTLNLHANKRSNARDVRRLATMAVKSGANLPEDIRRLQAIADEHAAETSQWVGADALAEGRGGDFDACDLRHWLSLAERAGVPYVPAREILSLSEEEMALASGSVELHEGPLKRRLMKTAAEFAQAVGQSGEATASDEQSAAPDHGEVVEKLAAAMDDVPDGWMVRHVRCGPSTLKALAGAGASGPTPPDARFNADLEVGPGWFRMGNRRHVDAADRRLIEGYAHGPDGVPSVFVARPWMEAARWAIGPDPHRHGTPFAGKGQWPAEWRAFVENGKVIGVASYYGWCGSATPENARISMEVRELAQRIVDEAARQQATPVFMPTEWTRRHPSAPAWLEKRFPRDSVNCTLDFIEVRDQGLMLLEGGPAFHWKLGGGHPCAFAGVEKPEGVAFRLMPHVLMGEPKTWKEGAREDCILSWEEVAELAQKPDTEADLDAGEDAGPAPSGP